MTRSGRFVQIIALLPFLAALAYGYRTGELSSGWSMVLVVLAVLAILAADVIRPILSSVSVESGTSDVLSQEESLREVEQQYPSGSPEYRLAQILKRLQTMVRRMGPVSSQTAIATAEVAWLSERMAHHLADQSTETGNIVRQLESITVMMHQVSVNTSSVAELAAQAKASSSSGQQDLNQTIEQMESITENADQTLSLIRTLNDKSEHIQDVTRVIEGIAEQTNLLALNAAIEAARAGEHGRGFAVVADEVRSLASRTADSTQQVAAIVDEIQLSTQQVVNTIEQLVAAIGQGSEKISATGERLGVMAGQFDEVEQQISGIAMAVQDSYSHVEEISGSVRTLDQGVSDGNERMQVLAQQADHLMQGAEKIAALLADHETEGMHRMAFVTCLEGAERIRQAFEHALEKGSIREADLFSREYQPIPGSVIGRCNSRYDTLAEQVLPAIQEELLERHAFGYAILLDDHCYIPVHNRQYSHPETGNPETDAVRCRGKRIFDNPVGVRGAVNKDRMLLQTYKRDTGEVLHDLSVPVTVNGRHWGAFRVGYLPASDVC